MFISFLISAFGFTFIHRILVWLRVSTFISAKLKQKLSIILFFSEIISLFLFKLTRIQIWAIHFSFLIFIFLIPIYVEFHRRNHFDRTLISNLDLVLLQMLSGKSFRESLQGFSNQKDLRNYIFSEICMQINSNQACGMTSTSKNVTRTYLEFKKIDESSHRHIDKLKSFRYTIKIEDKFRRKSRTAQMQPRAQSVVLSILYILAVLYFLANYDLKENLQLVLISFILFAGGTIWLWSIGRTLKWKV